MHDEHVLIGTNVSGCLTDAPAKIVVALAYYIAPDYEETEIAYPNGLAYHHGRDPFDHYDLCCRRRWPPGRWCVGAAAFRPLGLPAPPP